MCSEEKETKNKYGVVTHEFLTKNKNECIAIDLKGPIKTRHFKTSINENTSIY